MIKKNKKLYYILNNTLCVREALLMCNIIIKNVTYITI